MMEQINLYRVIWGSVAKTNFHYVYAVNQDEAWEVFNKRVPIDSTKDVSICWCCAVEDILQLKEGA